MNREEERWYKVIMIGLFVTIWVMAGIAMVVGANRVQPTYEEIYGQAE